MTDKEKLLELSKLVEQIAHTVANFVTGPYSVAASDIMHSTAKRARELREEVLIK